MNGLSRGFSRVFTVVPLIAFLFFGLSTLQAWGAGFIVTEPVVTENKPGPMTPIKNPWHMISILLILIGAAGYLQKKDSHRS